MLVRFSCLAVAHAFATLRLLCMTDREKDVEILALRHQLTVLRRQLGDQRARLRFEDRAWLAALLAPLGRATLRRLRAAGRPGHGAVVASRAGEASPRAHKRAP
ncbi:hypothetical protein GCM10022222_00030 [Amycolatopsis ultiminotia]|uniref:Transposase n=1 Tax=Amycolatopsis ultiminotia TaxID=543629 RepID=A0ABP6UXT3_9PSEU